MIEGHASAHELSPEKELELFLKNALLLRAEGAVYVRWGDCRVRFSGTLK